VPPRCASQQVPRPLLFYGWWMVWLGGLLSFLNKTAVNRGFPVFIALVRDSFGASNAAVAFRAGAGAKRADGPLGGLVLGPVGAAPSVMGGGAHERRRVCDSELHHQPLGFWRACRSRVHPGGL